ncbi:MAG: hypothetical protein M1826_004580 [Phylliscum demangeonii]|nr:MAG: hypothetical protein M1826_004580 [Phylliscum demangeonii]
MNWETPPASTPMVQAIPTMGPGPSLEPVTYGTPRSSLATFESFFPFSASPFPAILDAFDPDIDEPGPHHPLPDVTSDTPPTTAPTATAPLSPPLPLPLPGQEPSEQAGSQRSSTDTLTHPSPSPVHSPAHQQLIDRIDSTRETVRSPERAPPDAAGTYMPSPPSTSRSAGSSRVISLQTGAGETAPVHVGRRRPVHWLDPQRLSPRAARFSNYAPDLLEAFGYAVSAPATSSADPALDLLWDASAKLGHAGQDAGVRASAHRSSQHPSRSKAPGSLEGYPDDRGQANPKNARRPPPSSHHQPGRGREEDQAVGRLHRDLDGAVHPTQLIERRMTRTRVPSSFVSSTARQASRSSVACPSVLPATCREDAVQARRRMLKPRSNNGAVTASTPWAAGGRPSLKRRCTDDADHSARDGPGAGGLPPSTEEDQASVRQSSKRRSMRASSSRVARTTTVTFTIDDSGRARAEKRTVRRNVACERPAPTEDWDGLLGSSSGSSTDDDFDLAPSFHQSMVVPDVAPTRPARPGRHPPSARPVRWLPYEVRPGHRHSESVERPDGGRATFNHARLEDLQSRGRARPPSSADPLPAAEDPASEAETLLDEDSDASSRASAWPPTGRSFRDLPPAPPSRSQPRSGLGHHLHGSAPPTRRAGRSDHARRKSHAFKSAAIPPNLARSRPHPASFRPGGHVEALVRCVCGVGNDEEPLIQCDSCANFQHVTCMGLQGNALPAAYICVRCTHLYHHPRRHSDAPLAPRRQEMPGNSVKAAKPARR